MGKYVSLFFSMIFVLGNRIFGSFIPEPISEFVEIACIIAGAILFCVFLSYAIKEQLKTVEQNKGIVKNLLESLDKRLENFNQEVVVANKTICQRSDNVKNIIKSLDKRLGILVQEIAITKEAIGDIKNNISNLEKLPENIYKIVDELEEKITEQVGELCSSTAKDLRYLENTIDSNSKSVLREVKNKLTDFVESIGNFESDFSENIEKLSGEYENFQNITNAIIDKLTLMSEKDNEIIKGLFSNE